VSALDFNPDSTDAIFKFPLYEVLVFIFAGYIGWLIYRQYKSGKVEVTDPGYHGEACRRKTPVAFYALIIFQIVILTAALIWLATRPGTPH